jgi:hypothetical protein
VKPTPPLLNHLAFLADIVSIANSTYYAGAPTCDWGKHARVIGAGASYVILLCSQGLINALSWRNFIKGFAEPNGSSSRGLREPPGRDLNPGPPEYKGNLETCYLDWCSETYLNTYLCGFSNTYHSVIPTLPSCYTNYPEPAEITSNPTHNVFS